MDPDSERQMYDGWRSGMLPRIGTFDAMFRGPQVGYAYYVGGWMIRFLRDRCGEAAIVKSLRLWGEDRPMEEVFREAFGMELAQFDAGFHEFTGKRVSAYRLRPNWALVLPKLRERAAKEPGDGETLLRIAYAHFARREFVDAAAWLDRARKALPLRSADLILLEAMLASQAGRKERAKALLEEFFAQGGEDYEARLQLAEFLTDPADEGRRAEMWMAAKRCFPVRAEGRGNPYSMLAAWHKQAGRPAEELKELEEQARILPTNLPLRMTLADRYIASGRGADAIRILEEALRVSLFDLRIHRMLVPLYRAAGSAEKARIAARSAVALLGEKVPAEAQADAWLDLADLLLEDGRRDEARAAYEEAKKRAEEAPRVKEFGKKFENP